MKTKLILFTTIAIFALASSLIAEEVKYPPINPALTYWQSAALMPDLKGEKSNLLRDTINGKTPFDAAKTKEILSGSEGALRLFAKAADSPAPCDWGLPLEEGPEMTLPHVSKMMELSRLAILKADSLFSEGKNSEGIEWLLTAHRAARHAGAGDLLISALVQFSIEASAIKAAGMHCMAWDEATRKNYADGLGALPPLHSLKDAFRGELILVDWVEQRYQSTEPQMRAELENLFAVMGSSSGEPAADQQAAVKMFREQFTPENGPQRIGETRDLYRRTQEALGKPWKESQAELQVLAKGAREGNILVRLAYPSFESVSAKPFEIATLRTMLDAALQYGPKLDEAAAASFKDSFDGEPLVLKKGDDGSLTLTTARQYRKGKDIELKLGK